MKRHLVYLWVNTIMAIFVLYFKLFALVSYSKILIETSKSFCFNVFFSKTFKHTKCIICMDWYLYRWILCPLVVQTYMPNGCVTLKIWRVKTNLFVINLFIFSSDQFTFEKMDWLMANHTNTNKFVLKGISEAW